MVSCEMQAMATILQDRPEIEYLDGRPYPKVSPKISHSLVQGALVRVIAQCAGARGFALPEVRFDPGAVAGTKKTEFVPDVAFLSRERREGVAGKGLAKPPPSPQLGGDGRAPFGRLRLP